jgi:hypothetical protein
VRTSTGEPVTLLFVETGVQVLGASDWHRRLFRIAGGSIFAAVALAVIGLGVTHAVKPAVGTALTMTAPALAVAAGIAALTAWMLNIRTERALRQGRIRPGIAVEQVAWARSSHHDGRVQVEVSMTDGITHKLSAGGATGIQLAHRFGRLLAVTERAAGDLAQPRAEADPLRPEQGHSGAATSFSP